jgi:uncharacterized protein YpmS
MTNRDTNGETNGNGKSVTWKWLVGILVGLLFLIAGSVLSGMQADIKSLRAEKVDKEQYYRDIGEVKTRMENMDGKLDRLIQRRP